MRSTSYKGRIKGCLQCSKRRINCDRGEPRCKKCTQKGLECSGLNRIRFVAGVASRGKLKGSPIPVVPPATTRKRQDTTTFAGDEDDNDEKYQSCPSASVAVVSFTDIAAHKPAVSSDMSLTLPINSPPPLQQLQPWLPPIGHVTRGLFAHFAEAVAPVMVVVDSIPNGYRSIILPLACQDELLQRTVGVVAAQHVGQTSEVMRSAADVGRTAIIERLQRDCWEAEGAGVGTGAASNGRVFSVFTWATLIVLLVGETITSGSDYGPLLRMLLVTAQNCDLSLVPRPLAEFLMQQTHMFEVLARPQLNEQEGIEILSQSVYTRLDWIPHHLPQESEHGIAAAISREAFLEAFRLYLVRAQRGAGGSGVQMPLIAGSTVARLRSLVSQLDIKAEGAHALVWPCFVGSAESTELDDREFFLWRLNRIYLKTGFRNVRAAIESLPSIWTRQESWTAHLHDTSAGLIM
ncbi:hypothetical protein BX600DRAFT_431724 [Xylariales sp. PMI_506]|nr:hypothetical protein BX600DRAFT_431724 [Xylariales sp. PMI_506]